VSTGHLSVAGATIAASDMLAEFAEHARKLGHNVQTYATEARYVEKLDRFMVHTRVVGPDRCTDISFTTADPRSYSVSLPQIADALANAKWQPRDSKGIAA
jgi:hypothetical protein